MLMFLRLGAVALMGVIGTATYKEAAHAPSIPQDTIIVVPDRITPDPPPVAPEDQIVFRHGDVSWLPLLAGKAGWPEATWPRLAHIILRESGGCPYRRGGDAVDVGLIRTAPAERRFDGDRAGHQQVGEEEDPAPQDAQGQRLSPASGPCRLGPGPEVHPQLIHLTTDLCGTGERNPVIRDPAERGAGIMGVFQGIRGEGAACGTTGDALGGAQGFAGFGFFARARALAST